MRLILFIVGVIALVVPMSVFGEEGSGEGPVRWEGPGRGARVGVVMGVSAGDEVERWRGEFSERVGGEGAVWVEVIGAASVVVEADVEGVVRLRERGQEAYFYEGAKAARELLEQEVLNRLEVSRSWMMDQQGSEALVVAALFLLRAALDLGDEALVEQTARALVEAFPAHEVPTELFPPEIVALVEGARERLEREEKTSFVLHGLEDLGAGCVAHVNGAQVEEEVIYVVPWRGYLVGYFCEGDEVERSWWYRARAGERQEVVLFHEGMASEVLEEELRVRAVRGDLEEVVYIGPGDCGAELCVGAKSFMGGEQPMWFGSLEESRSRASWEGWSRVLGDE